MIILHITAHLGGGAGKAIVGLAAHTIKGCTTQIVVLDEPEKMNHIRNAEKKEIEIYIKPHKSKMRELVSNADIVVLDWWAHPLMIQFLYHFPKSDCRMIIWNHINGCTYPFLPFEFLNQFSYVLFTSPYSYENEIWTRTQRHLLWKKTELVYGMGEFQPIGVVPKLSYANEEKFTVGYIGTLNYGKLSSEFVSYCECAAEKIENIEFVVVGDISETVREDIARSRIAEKFVIVGHTNEVEKYYTSFDVFGYLLNRENYATTENTLLEAMSCGLPIIVMNNEVERHIIHDGHNGYIVKNQHEYADELYYLYKHVDERKRIGKSAREYALHNYSEEQNFNKFYNVCLNMVQNEKRQYQFKDVMGEVPFQWFEYFADNDGVDFKNYINNPNSETADRVKKCKPIFREKAKSSVFHFMKYFPEDISLTKIGNLLNESEN